MPLVAGIMGFCLSMSVICAPSISLEGRCLWILREAPVGESVLLWGKAGFQMLLTVPCTLAAAACLTWALALPVWQGVVLLAACWPLTWATLASGCSWAWRSPSWMRPTILW